jgi:dsDNA-binding SOS-regulon protein
MSGARVALAALALVACSERKPGTTAPATSAPPSGAALAPDAPKLTFAEGTPEQKLQLFCIDNYKKLDKCFKDDAFWQILATLFFAQNPQMDDGQPRTRSMWIGMRKDDFAALIREKRVPNDCRVSLEHSRWPTAATIDRVTKARNDSCPAFGNAFGSMLFVEGAFNQPR